MKKEVEDGVAESDPDNCYSIRHKTDSQTLERKRKKEKCPNRLSVECPNLSSLNNCTLCFMFVLESL